jgi:hypothetical protein
MRKLVLILLAFIAVVTFIRAFDNSDRLFSGEVHSGPEIHQNIKNPESANQ